MGFIISEDEKNRQHLSEVDVKKNKVKVNPRLQKKILKCKYLDCGLTQKWFS